ncbi:PREDICTED: MICAL-like protein 1 [Wasmannia auropunctata]|uniref:MICAL-like protein 1 n=1 Tax=Wasmannia auropunctata TaxID=64793 RepID=UPI0005ED6951|nr:PREDICTED: MICAL-like protein 1 [Wasmannia auropunctata]XP_011691646.1 PREDICTED: MICAL-like protein 1 [Wasmannia auropunctata]
MGERRGTKALELWCRRITDGYPGVNVQNMTTSWRDGLAFCAMIHHFRPDLIDFNSLNKDDVYRNNELAFRTAEQHLGIPALLDAEDMASCTVPDRLSILTYLSQFYQTFGGSSPSRLATNRTTETADERIAPVPESPKQKVGSRLGMRRDPCAACGLPVFLAEKLLIARVPYHRTCFRCARCSNQLTPGNYYETEEGQYCCETCPDEEEIDSVRHNYAEPAMSGAERETSEPRPLSDEEKTEMKGVLENAAVPDLISHTSQMRKNFMTSHLLSEKHESTAKDAFASTRDDSGHREEIKSRVGSAFPDDDENEEEEENDYDDDDDDDEEEEEEEEEEEFRGSMMDSPDVEESNVERYDVHSALNSLDIRSDKDQRSTAISFHDIGKRRREEEDTKESPGRAGERAETRQSLVQKRLQMFEGRDKTDHVDRTDQSKKKNPVAHDVTMVQGDSWHLSPDVLPASDEEERPEKRLEEDSIIKNTDKRKDSFENIGEQQDEDSKVTNNEENHSKNLVGASNEGRLDKDKQLENSSKVRSIERRKESFAKIAKNERIEGSEIDGKHYDSAMMGSSVLTAKGINLSDNGDYPEDLNPFKSDEEDNAVEGRPRTVINNSRNNKASTNPFDSEDEDVEEQPEPPRPAARSKPENGGASVTKRVLAAPQINLNPFWSDEDEEHGSDEDRTSPESAPVPKPRTIKTAPEVGVAPRRVDLDRGGVYASNSSLTSSESTSTPGGTYRKKKPAPQPPVAKELFPSDQRESPALKSHNSTLPSYHESSLHTTPRARKAKPAPPPPMPTSTPRNVSIGLSFDESPIVKIRGDDRNLNMWEDQKTNKDETNRNRQSLSSVSCGTDSSSYTSYADKSVQGKWKRKKGPAPPRPIPHRRKIKVISMKDVKLELDEIELQQQGLERQGVRLEQLIRDKCESGPRSDDSSLGTDVEELVLELFALVNEKNELFRRQAELMLLRRQQRLEEEHVEVEYQIRCLMCQPEATKTDSDKHREEALIQRLVEIVERRNEIVECLEMDRRREVEEDKSINKHMGLFAARNKNELSGKGNDPSNAGKTKKGKAKEKVKEKKVKKATKKDADKDVDETEVKLKRHGKRKWF